jgi:hypothetical protein
MRYRGCEAIGLHMTGPRKSNKRSPVLLYLVAVSSHVNIHFIAVDSTILYTAGIINHSFCRPDCCGTCRDAGFLCFLWLLEYFE